MEKTNRGSPASPAGPGARLRRGPLVVRGAVLGAAALAALLGGCLDDRGPAGLAAGPAQWGLVAQLSAPPLPGDAMQVRLTYARGTEPEGALATVVVPIPTDAAPGSSFSHPLAVDLAPCLTDPRHTPEGNSCSVTAHVVLTRGGVTLDEIVLGPFLLAPGQTSAPQSVTLHEVDRVEVAAADTGRLYPEATLALTGRVLDRDGAAIGDRAVTWASSATDVAMVDATTGMITAVAPGTAVISASAGGRTGQLTVRVWARPEIRLAPTAATFDVEQGQPLPAALAVAVTNGTEGELDGLVLGETVYEQPEGGWLEAALSGATAPATLTLRPAHDDLTPGTYSAVVPVSGAAAGASGEVRVTYTVRPPLLLALAPAALTFDGTGTIPPAQSVDVTAGGSVGPVTTAVAYVGSRTGWLDVALGGASNTPTTLTVRPNTTALPGGSYEADVTVSAAGARNTSQLLHVTYTLPPVTMTAAPDTLTFLASYESGLPPAQDVAVGTSRPWPGGAQVVGIAYTGMGSGWLDATVTGSGLPAVLSLQPNVTDIQAGRYDATVRVTVPGTGDTASVAATYYAGYALYAYSSDFYGEFYSEADTLALYVDLMASDESGALEGLPVTWTSLSPSLTLLSTSSLSGPNDSVRVTLAQTSQPGLAQVEARVGRLADTLDLYIYSGTARRARPPGTAPAPAPALRRAPRPTSSVAPRLRTAPPAERPRTAPMMERPRDLPSTSERQ